MSVPVAAPLSPAEIARRSGSSFLVSFAFLQPRRRRALTAVYAFCRVADDAVDEARDAAQGTEHLAFWRQELDAAFRGEPTTGVGRALQRAAAEFGVQRSPLEEVLAGVAMDLQARTYPDLPALEVYCHRVAAAVGLACLPVFGVRGPVAEDYARHLGQALQLVNILRDLRRDAQQGRVYVPADWLRETGTEAGWLSGEGPAHAYAEDGPLARLVERLVAAADSRFAQAEAALRQLSRRDRRRLLPPRIMAAVYRDLLARLAARGGELQRPVRVSKRRKLWLALRTALGGGGHPVAAARPR